MTRPLLCLGLLLSAPLPAQTESGQAFDIWALQRITRISDPQLSPDGSTVAFVGEKTLLSENAKRKHIYTLPVDGGQARQLTFEGQVEQPAAVVARFFSDRLPFRPRGLVADLADVRRRRRQASCDGPPYGSLGCEVFPGRGAAAVRQPRISGMRGGHGMQPAAIAGAGGQPRSCALLRRASVSALG